MAKKIPSSQEHQPLREDGIRREGPGFSARDHLRVIEAGPLTERAQTGFLVEASHLGIKAPHPRPHPAPKARPLGGEYRHGRFGGDDDAQRPSDEPRAPKVQRAAHRCDPLRGERQQCEHRPAPGGRARRRAWAPGAALRKHGRSRPPRPPGERPALPSTPPWSRRCGARRPPARTNRPAPSASGRLARPARARSRAPQPCDQRGDRGMKDVADRSLRDLDDEAIQEEPLIQLSRDGEGGEVAGGGAAAGIGRALGMRSLSLADISLVQLRRRSRPKRSAAARTCCSLMVSDPPAYASAPAARPRATRSRISPPDQWAKRCADSSGRMFSSARARRMDVRNRRPSSPLAPIAPCR